ncbi:enoyl-CoA hydratase/isomerase family protein [Skermania sp. ID1734]|uniref:enoyl-CoA hydratase/isomerase family protein n=1 Tax=Skermania sp. ID1734 TaxID=2597516 RepID=UPI00117D31A4|nr:enoyl-CoA hydratase-related protein [Skermania sp. ID1734]TSE00993.1 enoyl-CoA hydratase/isomerase family protein [Skermania sp. ID1734]
MPEFVSLAVSDGIGTIRIDRPPVNAITVQCHRELVAAARAASEDPDVAAVIIDGGPKVFSAGDDVAELATITASQMQLMAVDVQKALGAVAEIPKPTVAAISTYALGSGLEIALCADRRVIGDNVKLAMSQVLVGLIPGGGGTQRLTQLVGPSVAKDLIFTGRFVEPDEALRIGLVDAVVAPDDVYTSAREWAAQFVGGPARALAAAKSAIDTGLSATAAAGFEAERESCAALFATDDARAGMQSFLADGPGRAPFVGR